jgi:hypothetical protein
MVLYNQFRWCNFFLEYGYLVPQKFKSDTLFSIKIIRRNLKQKKLAGALTPTSFIPKKSGK